MSAMIERTEEQPRQALTAVTPAQMLLMAYERGADLDKLQQLMDLQLQWEANQARKAYVVAMSEFKKNPPTILKNRHVEFQTSKGTTKYDHADLFAVCDAVIEGLSNVGIHHSWEPDQSIPGIIKITCVLTHVDGHSTRTPLQSPHDDSGGKNGIQGMASAAQYLERYTLLMACGLATKGTDDDGRKAGGRAETITEKQAADLQAKATEVGANMEGFLKFLGVEELGDLQAKKFKAALQALADRAQGAR